MLPAAQETLRRFAVDSHSGRKWQARSGPRLLAHNLRRLIEWETLRGLAQATIAACGVHLHMHGRRTQQAQEVQAQQSQAPQAQNLSQSACLAARGAAVSQSGRQVQSRSQSVRAAGADAAVSQSGPQVQSQLVSQGRSQSASQQVQTQQSPQILATQEPRSKFASFCMQSALRHPEPEEAIRRRPSIDESQVTAHASQASQDF